MRAKGYALIALFWGLAGLAGCLSLAASAAASTGSRTPALAIGAPDRTIRPIPTSFLGLSLEYTALEAYAGKPPTPLNPVFLKLVQALSPGARPALRFGGDSTDWSWVKTPGVPQPPGIRFTITTPWLTRLTELTEALNPKLILGINLEANSVKIATHEAHALTRAVGRPSLQALEIGNEPELYATYGWYQSSTGQPVTGRPVGYDISDYAREYNAIARALPDDPLAGPATGGAHWLPRVGVFLARARRIAVATIHRYPMQRCNIQPGTPRYPTIGRLLDPSSSAGLAAGVAPIAAAARADRVPLRVDELNSVACKGSPGVSDTFASALWALDTVLALAAKNVGGVNIHTLPGAAYQLFTFHHTSTGWSGEVAPIYYGLRAFADAAPAHSRFLSIRRSTGPGVRSFATESPDGTRRIVLIADSLRRPRRITLTVANAHNAPADVEWLTAPRLSSTTGVSLGGQTFEPSTQTGDLPAPHTTPMLPRANGTYTIRLRPSSAAVVTIGHG